MCAESDELVSISSSAFLNLLLHIFRFWSSKLAGEKKIAYGLLLGYVEGNSRYIKRVAPLLHKEKRDLSMDKEFMRMVGQINQKELEKGSIHEVIGWYRASNDGIKFTAQDIKNHINFQDFNPKFIGLILDPKIYLDPEENGFSVFRLKGDSYYNMMTDYFRIPWEIEPIEDAFEIIADFQRYIRNYFTNQPLIKEINE